MLRSYLLPPSNLGLNPEDLRQRASVGFLNNYTLIKIESPCARLLKTALAFLIFDLCGRETKKEDLINW